jgi:hypothetical protein
MLIGPIALLLMTAGSGTSPPAQSATAAEDPDRVICRRPQAALGSRVARRRICRTVAEWRAFEEDRAQMRRDLNAGNCAGARSCSE